jgi:hypothetical protein
LAGPGYDLVTGLGTPKADALIPDLIKLDTQPPAAPVLVIPAGSSSTTATLRDPAFLSRRVDIVRAMDVTSGPLLPVSAFAWNLAAATSYPPANIPIGSAIRNDGGLAQAAVAASHANQAVFETYSPFLSGSDDGNTVPDADVPDAPSDKNN